MIEKSKLHFGRVERLGHKRLSGFHLFESSDFPEAAREQPTAMYVDEVMLLLACFLSFLFAFEVSYDVQVDKTS